MRGESHACWGLRTMDSPDRDFPRRGNELTSCQTSPNRKSPAVLNVAGTATHLRSACRIEPSVAGRVPSSANCDGDWQLVGRDRFDIENWERFKRMQSENPGASAAKCSRAASRCGPEACLARLDARSVLSGESHYLSIE